LPLSVDTSFPFEVSTPFINTNTVFYISSFISSNGCESERILVNAFVNPLPIAPQAMEASRCGAGILTFSINAANIPIDWEARLFAQPVGGTPIFIDKVAPYELISGSVERETTYYVEFFNTANGCSSPRSAAVAKINALPAAPIANEIRRCGPGDISALIFMGNPSGNEIRIYDQEVGGELIGVDSFFPYEFIFANQTASLTYYAEAIQTQTGCSSSFRTPLALNIQPIPNPPFAENGARCGAGSVVFTAFSANPTAQIRLYSQPFGGTILAAATSEPYILSTPAINTTTVFYLSAALGDCESERTPVRATVVATPTLLIVDNVSRCGPGEVAIPFIQGFSAGNSIRLYNTFQSSVPLQETSANMGAVVLPSVINSATYFIAAANTQENISCEGPRTPVVVTITQALARPTVSNATICGGGDFQLNASTAASNISEFRLYASLTASEPLQRSYENPASFSLFNITTTTTYFVSVEEQGCEGIRVPVTITVAPQPSLPQAADVERCGPGSVALTVTVAGAAATEVRLFDTMQGGLPIALATNPPYILSLPLVSTSATYYIESANSSCRSARRPVFIQINEQPAQPERMIFARCGSGNITLTFSPASTSVNEVRLYADNAAIQPLELAFNPPFEISLANVATNSAYFVSYVNQGCESPRQRISVEIIQVPSPPIARDVFTCSNKPVTISALMGGISGAEMLLYDAQANLLEIDNTSPFSFTPAVINATVTYFVASRRGACESPRVRVVATSTASPSIPFALPVAACQVSPVQVTALMGAIRGNEIRLYSSSTATEPIQIRGEEPYIFTLNNLTTNAIFYVSSAINSGGVVCESNKAPVSITFSPTPLPEPLVSNVQRCGVGSVTFTAANYPAGNTFILYNDRNSSVPAAFAASDKITLSSITTTTTYFAAFANPRCTTARVPVAVNFAPIPSEPSAASVRRCNPGAVNLSVAVNNDTFNQLRLYQGNSAVPVSILTSPPFVFTLPSVSSSTLFFISAANLDNSGGVCESNKVPVEIEITGTPSLPIVSAIERCGPGEVTLSVQAGNIPPEGYRLYTLPQGGIRIAEWASNETRFTTTVTNSTAFYVTAFIGDCETRRVAIPVTVNPVPQQPLVQSISICGNRSATLSVNDPLSNFSGIRIFATPSAGSPIAEDLLPPYTFTTPLLTTSVSYYVAALQGNCESARVEWAIERFPNPLAPRVNSVSRCGAGNLTFTIEPLSPGVGQVNIYTQPSGGASIAISRTQPFRFTAVGLTTSATYYFSSVASGCESERSEALAIINSAPSAPIAQNFSVCNENTATLTVTMGEFAGSQIRLYALASGGAPIAIDDSAPFNFTVSLTPGTSTFYASAASEDCESERIPIVIERNTNNNLPIISNLTRCRGEAATLDLEIPNGQSGAIAIYTDPNRQTVVARLSSRPYTFNAGVLTASTTYYATTIVNDCESAAQPFTITILDRPQAPVLENIATCGVGTVTFTIANFNPALQYALFSEANPSTPLNVERSGNLLILNNAAPGTYLVEARDQNCSARSTPITVQTGLAPSLNITVEDESCLQLGRIRATANSPRVTSFTYSLFLNNELFRVNSNGVFENLSANNYRLTVNDNSGCIVERIVSVGAIKGPLTASASNILQNGATLSWSAVPGAAGYLVRYRTLPDGAFVILEGITNTSVTISNLLSSTRFEYQIQAVCANGKLSTFSEPSEFTTAAPSGSCSEPASVSVVPESQTATVIWSRVPNAQTYNLRYRELPNGVFIERNFIPATSTSFILSPLLPNTSYQVQVQANCSATESSAFSALQRFTTLGGNSNICIAPQNLSVTPASNSATVTWPAVNGAVGYQLRYRERFATTFIEVNDLATPSFTIPNLNQSTIYEAQVRSICSGSVSDYSNLVSFQTEGSVSGVCITPVNFRIDSRTSVSAFASWTPNTSGAVCYILRYGPLNVAEEDWATVLVPHPSGGVEITGLIPGINYGARINTNCSVCSPRAGQQTPLSRLFPFGTALRNGQISEEEWMITYAYPNPTSGQMRLQFRNEIVSQEPIFIEIMELSGKVLESFALKPILGAESITLHLASYHSGVYLCRIAHKGKEQLLKVVKY
jgi:chitodextrinase